MDRASPSATAANAKNAPVVDYEGLMGRLPGLDFGGTLALVSIVVEKE
jgi:hypothetical protein